MHVCYGAFGVRGRGVQDVGDAAVGQELPVDGHFQVFDVAVGTEDFAQVRFVDVFGELFNDDFGAAWCGSVGAGRARGARAGVVAKRSAA